MRLKLNSVIFGMYEFHVNGDVNDLIQLKGNWKRDDSNPTPKERLQKNVNCVCWLCPKTQLLQFATCYWLNKWDCVFVGYVNVSLAGLEEYMYAHCSPCEGNSHSSCQWSYTSKIWGNWFLVPSNKCSLVCNSASEFLFSSHNLPSCTTSSVVQT